MSVTLKEECQALFGKSSSQERNPLKMPDEPLKPLLTWKQIAAYLKVSEKTAQQVFKIKRIPIFRTGRMVSTYPITLRRYLEDRAKPKVRKRIKEEGKSTREVVIELFQEYVKEIEKGV